MRKTALENWICRVEALPCLTRSALEALQLERLNAVLARKRARGANGLPERLSSLKELSSLPFTTPEALSQNPSLLLSQSEVGRVVSGVTSGTTGPAKRLFYSSRDLEHTTGFFAAGISEFTGAGDRVMIAMPFSAAHGLGDLIAKAVESLGAAALRVGVERSYSELSEILRREKPNVYIGMAVPLLSMLRFCGCAGLRRALVSGDACPGAVLSCIESMLCTKLFPHYGSRECALGGAVTCPAHEGMHLRENHIIAEIVDSNGQVLPDGQWGELVLSTIGMEAQPLLRYRTGDRTRILPAPCPCGGVTKRLDTVSRIVPSQCLMSSLDERLFRFPWLIDYSAQQRNNTVELHALYRGIPDEEALCAAAHAALPQFRFQANLRPAQTDDTPMYAAKRVFL